MLIFSMPCLSQQINSPPLQFEHYTSETGLPSREIQCGFKDSKGFLWIATIDGAYRYDGYETKYFKTDPYDSTTINIGWAESIEEDNNGMIWFAGTFGMGLNQYNPATGKFKRYNQISQFKKLLPSSNVSNMFCDKNKTLWIASQGEGLFALNTVDNTIVNYHHDSHNSSTINSNLIYSMAQALNNNIYVAASNGFDLLNVASGTFQHFKLMDHLNSRLNLAYNLLFVDSKNNLWLYSDEGILVYDSLLQPINKYVHSINDLNSLSCDTVNSICESPDGRIWIATDNGLNIFNPQTKVFDHYFYDENNTNSISTNTISKCFSDKSGKIWLLSENFMNAVNLLPGKFKVYKHDDKNASSICNNLPEFIYQDNYGKIFICTMKGISCFDPKSQKFKLFQPEESINSFLKNNIIFIIYQDKDDNYWINVDDDKLICFNPQTHHSNLYHFKENHHPDSLGVGYVWSILQDKKGIIWFGGENHLCSFNPETKKFKTYLINPLLINSNENSIPKIFDLNDGKIRFTCQGHAYYDYALDKIVIPKYKDDKKLIAMTQTGNTCYLTECENIVWLGTMGNGMFLYDFKNGRCRNFTSRHGLPNDVVWGILKDAHGNLWISTNNGLCKFTPPKNLFDENEKPVYRNYNTGDGLPIKEFGWNEFSNTKDGTMYFGMSVETSGLVVFHPDSLKDNSFISPVYITDFKLFNHSVIPNDTNEFLKNTVEFTKEIKLSYRENVISFSFAALNYVHPEQNQYAYMLEGFDKNWNYTDATKRFANYTNLDAGVYVFKVKGSNNDGVWNEMPTTLKLIITPPYWETWWFRISIAASVAAAAYALYSYRLMQIIKLQTMRNNIAADLHDEIGSTLNSISVFSEVARQQAGKPLPALENIGTSSRKIIDSMSDIVWTINTENDSFEKIILRMRNHAYQLLKAKNIELVFKADSSLNELTLPMQVRKNFYLIFKESLNNVVKYAEANRVIVNVTKFQNTINMEMRDNGKGFNMMNNIPGNQSPEGNGIKNMKQRAWEINAILKIESKESEGTSIELTIKT